MSRNWWGDLGVRAKPEFVYQNCVELIGHGGAHKHSCALKSLPIQNTCSITNFLPTFLSTFLKSKIKSRFKIKWMKLWRNFFPTNLCFLMWSIKCRSKENSKKKIFFVTKISFEGVSVCRICKHYTQESFVLLLFYRELLVIYQF